MTREQLLTEALVLATAALALVAPHRERRGSGRPFTFDPDEVTEVTRRPPEIPDAQPSSRS